MKPLTPVMIEAIETMERRGPFLRRPGGFWGPADAIWNGPTLSPGWGTSTIEGIVRRGYAQYTEWQAGRKGGFPVKVELAKLEKGDGTK